MKKSIKLPKQKILISDHCIERYRERIMSHRRWNDPESKQETIKKINREIDPRNILKVVYYGDDYKFVFTKKHTEFRFEKSNDRKFWVLVTCVRYTRLLASEEPCDIEQIREGHIYGIRTAIKIREKKKIMYESNVLKNKDMKEIMD